MLPVSVSRHAPNVEISPPWQASQGSASSDLSSHHGQDERHGGGEERIPIVCSPHLRGGLAVEVVWQGEARRHPSCLKYLNPTERLQRSESTKRFSWVT